MVNAQFPLDKLRIPHPGGTSTEFFATIALPGADYQLPRPQSPDPGSQVGMGIALVLLAVMVALAGGAVAKLEAMAPVTARAITRLRTMTFMVVYSLSLVTASGPS